MRKILIKDIICNKLIVNAIVYFDNNEEYITTGFNEFCIRYLSIDRIDAYVMGFLYFAMKYGYDIESQLPISEELYYNLEYHYIDALKLGNPSLYRVKIKAPIIKNSTSHKDIVATGISCGVDSLYTIAVHTKKLPDACRLNTLCFFNVGAAMKGEEELRTPLVQQRLDLAKMFASEYNFNFIFIESNIHLIFNKYHKYSHLELHTFMALFCLLHIQNGLDKYYYSSGYSYTDFTLNNKKNEEFDCAHYDLLTLNMASVNQMKFYSTGGAIGRLEKIKLLVNYPPAYKYLNVCVNQIQNDNICFKCQRTLLEINAVGDIEKFNNVFDVQYFRLHFYEYMRRLFINAKIRKEPYSIELYPYYDSKISFVFKIKCVLSVMINKLLQRKNGEV